MLKQVCKYDVHRSQYLSQIYRPCILSFLLLGGCFSTDSQTPASQPNTQADTQIAQRVGVKVALPAPASSDHYIAREDALTAEGRQLLVSGLKAEYVVRNVARMGDQMVLWPDTRNYTHIITCIEQTRSGKTPRGANGMNASIQRIDLSAKKIATVLHGMNRCDGVRTTAWGTIIVNEETRSGRVYEVLDPINTTGQWIADRATGDIRDAVDGVNPSSNIVLRDALPVMAWEGFAVLPSGVVTGGDEYNGGAIYKFVPDKPRKNTKPVTRLDQSPLVSGRSFALVCIEPNTTKIIPLASHCNGPAHWVLIDADNARADAQAKKATGFYRPEDMHQDLAYQGTGMRFCWSNTGKARDEIFGEVMCAIDDSPLPQVRGLLTDKHTGFRYLADNNVMTMVQVGIFIKGDHRFNSFDNLAFQGSTGNLFLTEDAKHGEIIACLPDGDDKDIESDGCISVLSVIDPAAEPTGLIFDASGQTAWYIVQHGEQPHALQDFASNPVDGRTDDLIMITGFKPSSDSH